MRRALLVGLLCCLGLATGLYLMSQNYIFKDKSRPFDVFLYKKAAPDTDSFESDVEGYCQLLRLPALAVGVARGDSLVFFKGVGTMGSPKDEPITADHAFPVAEVAETFTAIVLKQMEKEGQLSLEDPLSRYPNRFFNEARWDEETTLGHLVSHTSESVPHGSQFVYNDSKFNLVLNVFIGADKTVAEEIQRRILMPLNMDHTLLSYDERKHGYEMQSSVNDLVRYSVALGQNALLSATSYEQLTNPFYPGSPYGSGWFTTRFEGTVLHWSFGYDNNDAALLLRIPSSDLTFIMLVPGSVPPDLTRLGYGNPFNSMLVCSFFRNFVQTKNDRSRLFVEERFTEAMTMSLLPDSLHSSPAKGEKLLLELMDEFPADTIWQTPAAFERVAASENQRVLQVGLKMADGYFRKKKLHPVKAWYAGLIYQKSGKLEEAMTCYESLAWGDQYKEQPFKFDAMVQVAKEHSFAAPRHSREILQDLVRFKEYISVNDQQYKEVKRVLIQLKNK